jgi:hypothetical protein
LEKTAVISPDGLYRYSLGRFCDKVGDPMVFCMLNPSTADAEKDDPTIRRCMGFAKREGKAGIIVVNIFARRTQSPKELRDWAENGEDVIGPENEKHLYHVAKKWDGIVCAWGSAKITEDMEWFSVRRFWDWGARTYHLGKTKTGQPRHPLYVKADQPLVEFKGR